MDRYFLQPEGFYWKEVSEQEFIAKEQACGFHSKFGPNHVATGGFSSSRGWRGRIVSDSNTPEQWDGLEPDFANLLRGLQPGEKLALFQISSKVGATFRCACGANVFRKKDGVYICDACSSEYKEEPILIAEAKQ